jgi:hypothetical protein
MEARGGRIIALRESFMRRIAQFTIIAAALALSTLPLAAQDHTFHAAGTAPMHVAGATPIHAAGTFAPGHHFVAGPSAPVVHQREHRSAYPRYGYGYGYVYGVPYYVPYDNSYEQSDNGEGYEQPAPEPQENRVGPTIFEHNGQVSSARSEVMEREEPRPEYAEQTAAPLPATILIFRDGHQQEIESYAIAGAKLIVLGERPQKIQLTDLDLDATAKVNDDRGVDFKLPNQS